MTSPLLSNGQESIGVEMPQIRLAVQIKQNIDAALKLQAQYWDAVDRDVAAAMEVPYRQCVLEPPPRGSIYPGTRPGILGMPWDRFPAIATMVDRAQTTAESARLDFGSAYGLQIFVEFVVRSDEFAVGASGEPEKIEERIAQEGIADRRCKRMAEAIRHCVGLDPSLGGTTLPVEAPSFSQTDAFTDAGRAPEDKSKRRVFCYGVLQFPLPSYSVNYDASKPSPSVLSALGLGG